MAVNSFLNLYTHIQQADFKKLLKGRSFVVFQGQLVFEKDGEIFITIIEESRNDFTVEDYLALPENAPYELINGKLVYMPSPKSTHQIVSINLSTLLNLHVRKNKLGKVLTAPMDVHFSKDNVYQPDILFISNARMSILQEFVLGAPDFIVEILSTGTKGKDEGEKMTSYSKYGVREYWLVDPLEKTVETFLNKNDKMILTNKVEEKGTITSQTISGFSIELEEIFE